MTLPFTVNGDSTLHRRNCLAKSFASRPPPEQGLFNKLCQKKILPLKAGGDLCIASKKYYLTFFSNIT